MTLTREFRGTVHNRAQEDGAFRKALYGGSERV